MSYLSYNSVTLTMGLLPDHTQRYCYIDDGSSHGFGHMMVDRGENGGCLRAQLLDRVFPWNGTRVPLHADVKMVSPDVNGKWYSLEDVLQASQGEPYVDCWWRVADMWRGADAPPVIKMVRLRMCTSGGKQVPMIIEPGAAWHSTWQSGTLQPITVP